MKLNKRNIIKSILPLTLLLMLSACNSNSIQSENDEVNDTSSIKQPWAANSINSSLLIKDGHLDAIYQHYNKLTNALVEGKTAEAKIESNAIEAGAQQVKQGSTLASAAQAITSATSLQAQRFAYAKLSNELISLLKQSGISKGSLYIDFCPMAFNDKGAFWITNTKEIKNPYLGADMITCGQVKEMISND